jgi:hypothetical protein
VQNVTVIDGDPLLAKSAEKALKKWRYKPTMENGEPVEVQTTIAIVFALNPVRDDRYKSTRLLRLGHQLRRKAYNRRNHTDAGRRAWARLYCLHFLSIAPQTSSRNPNLEIRVPVVTNDSESSPLLANGEATGRITLGPSSGSPTFSDDILPSAGPFRVLGQYDVPHVR